CSERCMTSASVGVNGSPSMSRACSRSSMASRSVYRIARDAERKHGFLGLTRSEATDALVTYLDGGLVEEARGLAFGVGQDRMALAVLREAARAVGQVFPFPPYEVVTRIADMGVLTRDADCPPREACKLVVLPCQRADIRSEVHAATVGGDFLEADAGGRERLDGAHRCDVPMRIAKPKITRASPPRMRLWVRERPGGRVTVASLRRTPTDRQGCRWPMRTARGTRPRPRPVAR